MSVGSRVISASLVIALVSVASASAASRAVEAPRLVRAFGVVLNVPADWGVVYEATDFWAHSPEGPADLEATINPAPEAPLGVIGAAQVKRLRGYAVRAHPSTHLVHTTVGGIPALRLTWEYDATYEFGPHGGSPHRVRLCGTDYLFIHHGQLYDFSYQTIRGRLQIDGHVFAASIASLRFRS